MITFISSKHFAHVKVLYMARCRASCVRSCRIILWVWVLAFGLRISTLLPSTCTDWCGSLHVRLSLARCYFIFMPTLLDQADQFVFECEHLRHVFNLIYSSVKRILPAETVFGTTVRFRCKPQHVLVTKLCVANTAVGESETHALSFGVLALLSVELPNVMFCLVCNIYKHTQRMMRSLLAQHGQTPRACVLGCVAWVPTRCNVTIVQCFLGIPFCVVTRPCTVENQGWISLGCRWDALCLEAATCWSSIRVAPDSTGATASSVWGSTSAKASAAMLATNRRMRGGRRDLLDGLERCVWR